MTAAKRAPRVSIKQIPRISVCEDVARQILKLIAKGDLKPGQRLPSERELCADFGVGRSTLREALRCLSIIGVLDARVGDGTSVAASGGRFLGKLLEWRLITGQHDIESLIDVRLALECATASDTAKNASSVQIKEIRGLVAKMKGALGDITTFEPLDMEFHVRIAEASGNPLLFDLVSIIRSQVSQGVHEILRVPRALELSLTEHSAIVNAIEQRDPDKARKAMESHLSRALKRYRKAAESAAIAPSKKRSRSL
jgi:GntR family transcriptional repressor for pyruvate dehydrogenase complex